MKDVSTVLQKLCGVASIRFTGALGNIFYTNDFAAIIAQVCQACALDESVDQRKR